MAKITLSLVIENFLFAQNWDFIECFSALIQGDFASGGSGMLASEPQSSAHSEVAVVKQMVINQIDKKLKDLRRENKRICVTVLHILRSSTSNG